MSAFAMFSLKDPSLLAFDERRQKDGNLKRIYGIEQIPCDTQMRTTLDDVDPETLRPSYKDVFRQLQRGKVLEKMVFLRGYLVSLDGTGYFSSKKLRCSSCLEKKNAKTGEITYYHQLLGGAIVHPDRPEVIPLAPEPIIKQDGETKNDCERPVLVVQDKCNAAKRFLALYLGRTGLSAKLRQDHLHLPFIITEDALSSNAPHIRELQEHDMRFILGVKEGDHAFLFDYVRQAAQEGRVTTLEFKEKGILHRFRFLNQVPLNGSNQDLLVNFVEYWEITPEKTQHFSWVTDLTVSKWNVYHIMRGGRAHWKIENETFNTLKNQGYHFEHNFGHGQNHLSVVFAMLSRSNLLGLDSFGRLRTSPSAGSGQAPDTGQKRGFGNPLRAILDPLMLMMLAFLVDQVQQLACRLFQAVLQKEGSRKRLWEHMRALFYTLEFNCLEDIWRALLYGYEITGFVICDSS